MSVFGTLDYSKNLNEEILENHWSQKERKSFPVRFSYMMGKSFCMNEAHSC